MVRTTIKLAMVAAVAGGAAVLGSSTAFAATPTLTKSVAYVRGGVIYVSKDAKEVRLTEDQVNSRPRYAPDGKRIAFVHNGTVWVMNADGTGKRQVSDRVGGGPAWSPDGSSIAFAGLSCTGGPGVYRVSSLTPGAKPEVVFPKSCRGQALPEVASVMSTTTSTTLALADRLRTDDAVAWSPDGTLMAFRGGECENVADACLSVGNLATGGESAIDVYGGGGNLRKGFAVVPAWRADGKKVTWTAYADGTSPVHVEESDTSGANRRKLGAAEDREMVYMSAAKGVLTSTYQGRSWVTILDLATGKRTRFHAGSQPTVQP